MADNNDLPTQRLATLFQLHWDGPVTVRDINT